MCFERLSDDFEMIDTRVTDVAREEDLEHPDLVREPADEPEEVLEREREYAHA